MVTSAGPSGEADQRSLRRSIGTVASASALAVMVGELVSLVQTITLARLLSPAEVGYFVAGTVLVSFVSNFVEGGLRSGLVHREHRLDDAAETVFWATLSFGLVMTLATLGAAPLVALIFDSREAGLVAASMSGVIVLYSLTNVPEALLQRQFNVRRRLFVGPAVAISFAIVSIAMAWMGYGVWSLVAGSYVSYVVWVLGVWLICGWRPARGKASFTIWRELARYGFPLVLAMFGDRAQKMAQAGVTGAALGPSALGLLRYGERIARIPVNAMVEVASISLFPAFARIAKDGSRLRDAYLRALGTVTLAAAAITAMMIAVGEPLVVLVLGETWRGAGQALVAMAGLGVGKAFMIVGEEAIKGAGRTRLIHWLTLSELVLSLLLLVALVGPLGLVGVGLSISVTAVLVGGVVTGLAMPVVRVSLRQVAGRTVPSLIAAVVGLSVVGPLEALVVDSSSRGIIEGLAAITLEAVIFLLLYLVTLRLLGPTLLSDVTALVRDLMRRSGSRG